jgi:TRAP-type mannitol/chloroaromatic compound transport system permease large subunit
MDIVLAHLDLLMFAVAILVLLSGYPVAIALAGVALLFAGIAILTGHFDAALLSAFPNRIYGGVMTRQVMVAVPLFVFMGVMLERSNIAAELLETMGRLFGKMRGGLGISVILVGALLAASTGIVGATVVTMGLLSLPTMVRHGYSPSLSCGAIAASGTLVQIIPPSIVLVLLGDVISNAYQRAQLDAGNFAPRTISVGDLFAGALLPGLLLVVLYLLWMVGVAYFRPDMAPAVKSNADNPPSLKVILGVLLPPLLLIFSVLGSILGGLADVTEAAGVGALGALFLAASRIRISEGTQKPERDWGRLAVLGGAAAFAAMIALAMVMDLRLGRSDVTIMEKAGQGLAFLLVIPALGGILTALWRLFSTKVLQAVSRSTAQISAMVFVILIGATLFSLVFRGLGGDDSVERLLLSGGGGPVRAVVLVMLVMFFLGFFLDFIEITFVVVPIVGPILLGMGIDPIWLGVMMAINLQTSFLTPPFGFALFYLRGVAPKEIRTAHIYRGALPFVAIQIVVLALVALFPGLATALPHLIYG